MFGRRSHVGEPLHHFLKSYATQGDPALDYTIHPDDQMYAPAARAWGPSKSRMVYVQLGSELTCTIKQIANWRFGPRLDDVRFLEFACGYGRVVRHLTHVFPRENIFVSDIMKEAVDFNMAQFKVAGRVSVHEPADLDWPERFDMIVVPSLFSHLPERTFAGWIKALHSLLREDGILVFSVHGDNVLSPESRISESGILFLLESENDVLDKEEYGLTYVTEAFVRDQIRKATGSDTYSLTRRGFCKHQDFYILSKGTKVDLSSFRYDRGLMGKIDTAVIQADGTLSLSGWAVEACPGANRDVVVRAYINDTKVAESPVVDPRPDVAQVWGEEFGRSGFSIAIASSSSRSGPDSVLRVEVASPRSVECIHVLDLRETLAKAVRNNCPLTKLKQLLRLGNRT
jgi:SAM-dependent methyltransferase